jgi:hypothetical protein
MCDSYQLEEYVALSNDAALAILSMKITQSNEQF